MNVIFVVDTNSYAGNFEREMCAYMTGCLGDTNVGQIEASLFLNEYETPLESVIQIETESGKKCAEIFETPNIFNNGVGFHFSREKKEEAVNHFKQFYKNEYENQMKLFLERKDLSEEEKTIEVEKLKKKLKELEILEVEEHPAYFSVGIYLKEINSSLLQMLKTRAKEFAEFNSIEIIGFRILMRKEA